VVFHSGCNCQGTGCIRLDVFTLCNTCSIRHISHCHFDAALCVQCVEGDQYLTNVSVLVIAVVVVLRFPLKAALAPLPMPALRRILCVRVAVGACAVVHAASNVFTMGLV